jgi:hypothetical protein
VTDPYEYPGRPFGFDVKREGARVVIKISRGTTVLVEINTSTTGAQKMIDRLERALA